MVAGIDPLLAGAAAVIFVLLAVTGFWLYRKRKKQQVLQRIRDIADDVERAMRRRGVRHPKLLQHKLDAAARRWEQGKYREAERIMEDVERLVQLS